MVHDAGRRPDESLDAAIDAALALAAERPWREVSLREIAERAGVDFAELYAEAPAKPLLVLRLSQQLDRAALATAATPSDDVHDRLFDAAMARVEAMEPHRDGADRRCARRRAPIALAPHFPLHRPGDPGSRRRRPRRRRGSPP